MSDPDLARRVLLKALPAGLALAAAGGAVAAAAPPVVQPPGGKLRIVALEEHFMLPEMQPYFRSNEPDLRPGLLDKVIPVLSDFGERRLAVMDQNGVDFVVLSLSGPGVQIEPDAAKATALARRANDRLAHEVSLRPARYGGFAHLALQDPKGAADELERCMTQLHFHGAMINGQTNGLYLDEPRYDVFWERAAALGAPIYIHPANPPEQDRMYDGHPELWGPTWSWAVETCNHALRLIFRGVFDRHPGARVILGHMGETLPIQLWRLDSRYVISRQEYPIKQAPSAYVKSNIFITTAGVCSDAALRCTLDALGQENVLFSIDFPYENTKIATDWIRNTTAVTTAERNSVTSGNAARLLKL